jgi:hypothetical protein
MGSGNVVVGSGVGGRSVKTQASRALAGLEVSGTKALLTTRAGATVKAIGGGKIIARANGVIMGSGTFTGRGLIQNGGALVPGNSAGTLTWIGNLMVESGGLLEIEVGGPTAGTQHDRVNVSGTFTMNGSLSVRMLNGFGGTVQPTDVFDIVTASAPIATGLSGTRVAVFGTNGSFEVQLANGGNTLRLANYQTSGPITFSSGQTATASPAPPRR